MQYESCYENYWGSAKFKENFKNIARAHISRNKLAFIRFPILIEQIKSVINSTGLGGERKAKVPKGKKVSKVENSTHI